MKHSLDLRIVSNNQDTLDGIMAALPGADDSRVWSEQYETLTRSVDENGDNVISGMIRFNEDQDRADVAEAAEAVEGMFYLCEPGSYLRLHTCYHDETPAKPCEVTVLYEVVEE